MNTPKYIVKESQFDGLYSNPYRKGGKGWRWKPWKTISKHDTLREAIDASLADRTGIWRTAVYYKGKRLTDGATILSGLSISQEVERLEQEGSK